MAKNISPDDARLAGFTPAAFAFLKELAETQDREWFQAHKTIYEEKCKEPMAALIRALAAALAARGLCFHDDPKQAMFRINRDIRFSQDKNPYKTHLGAALTRDGDKRSPGVLYIHIEPKDCFAAAGFYQPEPAQLHSIRKCIAENPKKIKSILHRLSQAGISLIQEEMLKRLPAGFESVADPQIGDWLRLKSLAVRRPLTTKVVANGNLLLDALTEFTLEARPLLEFGWDAIGSTGGRAHRIRGKIPSP